MKPGHPESKNGRLPRRGKRLLLSCYRIGLIAAAALCLHHAGAKRGQERSDHIDPGTALPLVQRWLPTAATVGPAEGDDRLAPVLDARGEITGWATQTAPEARAITGFAGPSNLLVIFDPARRVLGTHLLDSADTPGHVAKVATDEGFFSQWNGLSQSSLGSPGTPRIVSGASLTSEAIARGVAARFGASGMDRWFPEKTSLEQVRMFFPAAAELRGEAVIAGDGSRMGTLLRSSTMDVVARGFQGAADVLVALDADETRILGVAMPASRDNEPYTGDVQDTLLYDKPFAGMSVEQALEIEPGSSLMTSGASRTAESVEESVKEMLRRHTAPPPARTGPIRVADGAALAWIAAGLAIGLGPLRGNKRARTAYAIASVAIGGLWLGLMTGQDQWIKWSLQGKLPVSALPLVALTACALLVPAAFGKNVYCSQICPHGAAQQLLGHLTRKRFALPAKIHRVAGAVPWLTLGLLWLAAFLGLALPLSHAEPFEVWSAGFIALVPVLIFFLGLIAAVFLPRAYCHYGCPTGAVLKFLSSSPGRWTRRDGIAGGCVALAWAGTLFLSR